MYIHNLALFFKHICICCKSDSDFQCDPYKFNWKNSFQIPLIQLCSVLIFLVAASKRKNEMERKLISKCILI